MADIACYTACYGGFDTIRAPVAQHVDVDWICFTDDPALDAPAPWAVRRRPGRYPDPRLSAKRYKCLPHVVLSNHKQTVWIDANMEVTSPDFVTGALDAMVDGLAVWRHPQRDCIYDEADATVRLLPGKYEASEISVQAEHYRNSGYPRHAGLYACGTLARLPLDPIVELGADWFDECLKWSPQDQISFPVVCHQLGITPGVFPHPQITRRSLSNPWLRIHRHNSDR